MQTEGMQTDGMQTDGMQTDGKQTEGLNEGTALVLTWAEVIHSSGILKVCKRCQFKYIQHSPI